MSQTYDRFEIREIIIKLLKRDDFITPKTLAEEVGCTPNTAFRHLTDMELDTKLIKKLNITMRGLYRFHIWIKAKQD